jgi:hypothetical protein
VLRVISGLADLNVITLFRVGEQSRHVLGDVKEHYGGRSIEKRYKKIPLRSRHGDIRPEGTCGM